MGWLWVSYGSHWGYGVAVSITIGQLWGMPELLYSHGAFYGAVQYLWGSSGWTMGQVNTVGYP